MRKGRVLFVGHCYYNPWYLSRGLRKLGWKADVLNIDGNPDSQKYYHGEDFKFTYNSPKRDGINQVLFYLKALMSYDIFHFSNAQGLNFGPGLAEIFGRIGIEEGDEIRLLKKLGKKIVYSNNGCLDGVSQTAFKSWEGSGVVCDDCPWKDVPSVCCDEKNLAWGAFRNSLVDYQCYLGGNRKDYNDDIRVHEVPEFYCLDSSFWNPNLPIPLQYRLSYPSETVKIYHAVGNYDLRTDENTQRNVKSTHIYVPLIKQLKQAGYPIELIFAKDIPNTEVRFLQAQSDIVVDMLTFGFFGANVREALMLGKPVICFMRPAFLDGMRREIPDYVRELPIVSATPETVHDVLVDLITHPEKRREIGKRGREFAVKWHSAEAGAKRFDKIYTDLLGR